MNCSAEWCAHIDKDASNIHSEVHYDTVLVKLKSPRFVVEIAACRVNVGLTFLVAYFLVPYVFVPFRHLHGVI